MSQHLGVHARLRSRPLDRVGNLRHSLHRESVDLRPRVYKGQCRRLQVSLAVASHRRRRDAPRGQRRMQEDLKAAMTWRMTGQMHHRSYRRAEHKVVEAPARAVLREAAFHPLDDACCNTQTAKAIITTCLFASADCLIPVSVILAELHSGVSDRLCWPASNAKLPTFDAMKGADCARCR